MSGPYYPFGQTVPELGVPMEVAPGIKWLRMPLPFVLNHVNLWMIEDDGGWCQIDTGLMWDTVKALWLNLFKTHKLTRQIVTHFHPDHIGLAGWLQQKQGIDLWISQGEYLTAFAFSKGIGNYQVQALADMFRLHGLDEKRLTALKQTGNDYPIWVPSIPDTFRRLFDNQIIRIGKHDWKVILGSGHSVEHASFYCDALKVLIGGDMLLPSISTNIPVMAANPLDNPLKQYLISLQRYRELPPDTLVLPSHGRPFSGIHARVSYLNEHHQLRCNKIVDATQQEKTACELLPVLFDWGDMDSHQLTFALGETIAHLNYLKEQNRIRQINTKQDAIIRFQAGR